MKRGQNKNGSSSSNKKHNTYNQQQKQPKEVQQIQSDINLNSFVLEQKEKEYLEKLKKQGQYDEETESALSEINSAYEQCEDSFKFYKKLCKFIMNDDFQQLQTSCQNELKNFSEDFSNYPSFPLSCFAVLQGKFEALKILENNNLNLTLLCKNGKTPLHYASIFDKDQILIYLANKYPDQLAVFSQQGLNCIQYAARHSSINTFKLLINQYNQDPRLESKQSINSLQYASMNDQKESITIIKFLVEEGFFLENEQEIKQLNEEQGIQSQKEQKENEEQKLIYQQSKEQKEQIKDFQTEEQKDQINEQDQQKFKEKIKMNPFIINQEEGSGLNCLHYAAIFGCTDNYAYLIEILYQQEQQNIQKNVQQQLQQQSQQQQKRKLQNMHKSKSGLTMLNYASMSCSVQILQLFFDNYEFQPDDLVSTGGMHLIHSMAHNVLKVDIQQQVEFLELLIQLYSQKLEQKSMSGCKISHFCVSFGNLTLFDHLMIKEKMDPNEESDEKAITPFIIAVMTENENLMLHLIKKYSVNPNKQNSKQFLPLHYASIMNKVESVKYLVQKYNSDPYVISGNGYSSLHYAAYYSANKVLEYYVQLNKYDFNVSNKYGESVYQSAKVNNNVEGMNILSQFQSNFQQQQQQK